MRSTLDKIISAIGLLMAVVLLGAGGLMFWASSFIGGQVHDQLTEQRITMPTKEALQADEGLSPADRQVMEQYAGSPLDTGAEAKAYADNFIKAHLSHATDGETYSTLGPKVNEACGANREKADTPECQAANGQRETAFKGSTLRGLLLYGYAFATMGTIAGIAAWVAVALAVVMLVLSVLGFVHARRVSRAAVHS